MHRWTKNIYVTQDFYLSFSHACFCNKVKPLKKKHNPLYSFKGLPFSFYYILALYYTVNTHTQHTMYCDFLKTIPLDFTTPCYLGLQLMLFSTCNFVQLLLTQTCRCTEGKKRRKNEHLKNPPQSHTDQWVPQRKILEPSRTENGNLLHRINEFTNAAKNVPELPAGKVWLHILGWKNPPPPSHCVRSICCLPATRNMPPLNA